MADQVKMQLEHAASSYSEPASVDAPTIGVAPTAVAAVGDATASADPAAEQ